MLEVKGPIGSVYRDYYDVNGFQPPSLEVVAK